MRVSRTFALCIMAAAVCSTVALPVRAHERWGRGDIRHFHDRDWDDWHRGHWDHDWHDGRLGWWWVTGGVWFFYPRPIYPYPDPYIPPDYAWAPPRAYWYYCPPAATYYPYVQICPVPWKPVPAGPP